MTKQEETLAKLHKLKTGAIKLYQEYLKAFDLPPAEQVEKLEQLSNDILDNKTSDLYGLQEQINEIECSIDDGDILEIQFTAICDCAEKDIINADEYDLNTARPNWRGAVEGIVETL